MPKPEHEVQATTALVTDQASDQLSKTFLANLQNALDMRLKVQHEYLHKLTATAFLTAQKNQQNPPNWSKETMQKAVDKIAANADKLGEQSALSQDEKVKTVESLLINAGIFKRPGEKAKEAQKAEEQQNAPQRSTPRK